MQTPDLPRPLRRDAERNRQRLLDAAAELFAERGLSVQLPDIAARAGVGVATAYRRFPDREALIDELFNQRMAVVVAAARDGLDADDPWEGFAGSITRILEHQASSRGLAQLMVGEIRTDERKARLRAHLYPVMHELVLRAQAAGTLRPDVVTTDVPILNLMLAAGLQATHPVAPDHWRRMLAIVLDGLRTRRDGPSPLPSPGLDLPQTEAVMRGAWLGPRPS